MGTPPNQDEPHVIVAEATKIKKTLIDCLDRLDELGLERTAIHVDSAINEIVAEAEAISTKR